MAGNIVLNPGVGGSTLATDDNGSGIQNEVVKLAFGASGAPPTTADSNSGNKSAGTIRVVIATDQPALTNALKVDGSGVTQPVSGTVTANAGSGTLAVSVASLPLPAGASTSAKQPALGTAGTASSDVISVQGIASMTPITTTVGLATSGGYSNSSINAANSNNSTSVKGSAGQVYGVHVYNNATYPVYVKLYNKATAPAPATDNALLIRRIGVQAGTSRDMSFPAGIPFASGIGLAIVKGISDTDNTSVAASDALVEVEFN